MMFLIRTAFWLTILVLLLPTDEQQQSQVFGTAEAAVKDVSGFCDRNPGVCAKGKGAFEVFVHKAQFGAQMIMGFVQGQASGEPAGEAVAPKTEGGAAAASPGAKSASAARGKLAQAAMLPWLPASAEPASTQATASRSTLTLDDLAPAWSGPNQAGA